MKRVRARVRKRITRTPTIESFRVAPEEKMDFLPGQFMRVVFDEKDKDNKALNKYLSFSSAPGKEYIEFTKRLSDSLFSRALKGLRENDTVALEGPFGQCVFKDEFKKIAFLVGGIGITPVISMIEYITEKNLATDIVLFYSNRDLQETAFKKELDAWRMRNENLTIWYTVTDCPPPDDTAYSARSIKCF
jgi:ferredoxin-NADP reductase